MNSGKQKKAAFAKAAFSMPYCLLADGTSHLTPHTSHLIPHTPNPTPLSVSSYAGRHLLEGRLPAH